MWPRTAATIYGIFFYIVCLNIYSFLVNMLFSSTLIYFMGWVCRADIFTIMLPWVNPKHTHKDEKTKSAISFSGFLVVSGSSPLWVLKSKTITIYYNISLSLFSLPLSLFKHIHRSIAHKTGDYQTCDSPLLTSKTCLPLDSGWIIC